MKKLGTLGFIFFVLIQPAFGSGLSKPVLIGPKAIGMGGAFVGIADDPTAIFHNPAGMTQMQGHHIEIGMDALITDEHYTPPTGPTENANREFLPVPQFGYVYGNKPYAFGIGVFFPHGNGGSFPTASSFPTNPKEGRIYSMEIDPAMSMELIEGLSLGGSVRVVRVSSSLKGQIFPPGLLGPTVVTLDDLEVSGWGLGGSIGALYKPCKYFSLGANYRTKVVANLSGTAKFDVLPASVPAVYDQTLPSMVTTGIGFTPLDKLTVGVSYDFERNSEINTINATINNTIPVAIAQNFRDSHTVHVGAEYWLVPTVAFRGGYARDFNTSIPDTTMNRIIGDIDAHEVSAGLGYKWDRYMIGATWNARFGSRNITATSTTPGPGQYEAFVQSISLGVEFTL